MRPAIARPRSAIARLRRAHAAAGVTVVALATLVLLATPAHEARGAVLLTAGSTFPTWSLRDQTGKEVTSRDLAGKTYLLWFFPKAMTPGCTREGDGLRDAYASFHDAGVEVLGVSFDAPAENAKFVAQEHFPFRLLSDDGTLAVQVGAADAKGQPAARRISYLVGADGKVVRSYGSVDPATHAREVLDDLARRRPS